MIIYIFFTFLLFIKYDILLFHIKSSNSKCDLSFSVQMCI